MFWRVCAYALPSKRARIAGMHKVTESKEKEESSLKGSNNVEERKSAKDRLALLLRYKKHAEDNEIEIVQSKKCGCYFCRQVYDARNVQEWIDDERGVTALCPECGMDAVIGDASGVEISKPLMKEMNLAFYGEEFMDENPEAARTYCGRYQDGKIAHKEKSEALYIHYLTTLEDQGDPIASLSLGDFYFYGSEFTEKDYSKALIHYSHRSLFANPKALCGLGLCYLDRMEDEKDSARAYIAFSKAAALGSMEAVYHLADCYEHGYFVAPDYSFAYQLIETAYNEALNLFAVERMNWFDYPELAYRMAHFYEKGIGVERNEEAALKYYLLTELSSSLRTTFMGFDKDPKMLSNAQAAIEELGKKHKLIKNPMVYDVDTFEDSLVAQGITQEERTLANVTWNEETNELEFDIVYPLPTLIVDIGNLTAGFVTGTVHWSLKDVANYKLSGESHFTRISGNYDDGFAFSYQNEEGELISIFEIYFRPDRKEENR